MSNPYDFNAYDFRFTARWQPEWPTILGRLNLILERLDWCKFEIDNAGPGGGTPAGTWDDPYEIGGARLWHDATNHVLRVKESAPSGETDGVEIGTGGTA